MKSSQLILECYKEQITEELQFVASYIFEDRLGIGPVGIVSGSSESSYSLKRGNQLLCEIPNLGYFRKEGPVKMSIGTLMVSSYGSRKLFSIEMGVETNDRSKLLDFDLFAAVFYCITRQEELEHMSSDPHGRFLSKDSWMAVHDCLEVPVVDYWLQEFGALLNGLGVQTKPEQFEWWNTIDVDQIYASKNKPIGLRFGQVVKALVQGQFNQAYQLSKSVMGSDPFDTLDAMYSKEAARNICFLLLQSTSEFDSPHNKTKNVLSNFIGKYGEQFEMGLHPSYNSSSDTSILEREVGLGRGQIVEDLDSSRQHYLRFKWPDTMEELASMGLRYDFSMGFADRPGFRAGTSRPFPFFDVKKRKKTTLTVVPFSVMDVTLRHYMKLDPDQAIERIKQLVESLKGCNGLFVSLWHNETYSVINGWEPWKRVFEEMKLTVDQ